MPALQGQRQSGAVRAGGDARCTTTWPDRNAPCGCGATVSWTARPPASASGRPASLRPHRAISLVPKDIVICDWHYDRALPTTEHFAVEGFPVLACPWRKPDVALAQLDAIRRVRSHATDAIAVACREFCKPHGPAWPHLRTHISGSRFPADTGSSSNLWRRSRASGRCSASCGHWMGDKQWRIERSVGAGAVEDYSLPKLLTFESGVYHQPPRLSGSGARFAVIHSKVLWPTINSR